MDERALRKLAAAAEHERQQATVLAAAVPLIEAKVERAKADLEAAGLSLAEARDAAAAAEDRAATAETAYRTAADGQSIGVRAAVAAAFGDAGREA